MCVVSRRTDQVSRASPYGANTTGRIGSSAAAAPAEAGSGVRDALAYGASAPQTEPGARRASSAIAVAAAGLPPEGEDCLVLNVWTPAVKDNRKRPVMVWCHGGGFATGSGSSPVTDGRTWRGAATWWWSASTTASTCSASRTWRRVAGADFAASGDVGMLDIVQALEWVRDNIAEFGGDPNTVMVFGQSGGGRKVATLLAMPSAKGLFHRAVIESGATLQLVER